MLTENLRLLSLTQKKKNTLIFKGILEEEPIVLKCAISPDAALAQALTDEYHVMSRLSHPSIPEYYGLTEELRLSIVNNHIHSLDKSRPDVNGSSHAHDRFQPNRNRFSHAHDKSLSGTHLGGPVLALCMQDCSSPAQVSFSTLSLPEILHVLLKTGQLLSWLLEKGVLYTDLNPTNILLSRKGEELTMYLVDYTYCYFFLENPYPDYSLRFSYNLSPHLKGQQLLIQELSYFLEDLLSDRPDLPIPSDIYRLLETGRKPSEHLSLSDFLKMIVTIQDP